MNDAGRSRRQFEDLQFPDRREFLARMGRWSLGLLLSAAGLQIGRGARAGDFASPGFPRPPLPGACLQPAGKVEETLAAVIDTVVPGPEVDPDGAPGALEACSLNLLLDEYYPLKSYASLVANLMDKLMEKRVGGAFVEASYADRLQVLVDAQESLPVLRLAYRAIRSAFYGGAYNGVGLDYVGYPGPNLGYRHLAEASFRKAVCQEMSETGWLP